jgi:mersacidin/lichenicidin family type 2 lantibiotic
MATINVIRAWRDEEYRMSLTEAELAQLPANPVGGLMLTDEELKQASGGTMLSKPCGTCYACTDVTFNYYGYNCCTGDW